MSIEYQFYLRGHNKVYIPNNTLTCLVSILLKLIQMWMIAFNKHIIKY